MNKMLLFWMQEDIFPLNVRKSECFSEFKTFVVGKVQALEPSEGLC